MTPNEILLKLSIHLLKTLQEIQRLEDFELWLSQKIKPDPFGSDEFNADLQEIRETTLIMIAQAKDLADELEKRTSSLKNQESSIY